ncbi:hypothetical protein SBD_0087 [Streptomyces bottropensis ATCC 25435]|uniref:Uncharacterized protein n=1 Tax=Streptomyces bottropensis ATCC 25435 TaxID=1054862 RepID=M3FWN3_9ACTN|nr:hypothetical protein SBD_0087 [Streptomyces bottropensis ATCC 25435]
MHTVVKATVAHGHAATATGPPAQGAVVTMTVTMTTIRHQRGETAPTGRPVPVVTMCCAPS